jgi:hypothetical protein
MVYKIRELNALPKTLHIKIASYLTKLWSPFLSTGLCQYTYNPRFISNGQLDIGHFYINGGLACGGNSKLGGLMAMNLLIIIMKTNM